jgi:hypothetical protein
VWNSTGNSCGLSLAAYFMQKLRTKNIEKLFLEREKFQAENIFTAINGLYITGQNLNG